MPRQLENSSWRCSWTWTQTVIKLSTPTSRAPQTPRTSALSLLPSRTPSSSWTWRSTTWSNCASSTPPFPSLVGYWSCTRGTVFLWKTICIILIYCRPGLCVNVSTEFVVNIMILFKLFRGNTGCWSTVPAHFLSLFFRQNLVTRCILNPRHALAQISVVSFSLFFFSFLFYWAKQSWLPFR